MSSTDDYEAIWNRWDDCHIVPAETGTCFQIDSWCGGGWNTLKDHEPLSEIKQILDATTSLESIRKQLSFFNIGDNSDDIVYDLL